MPEVRARATKLLAHGGGVEAAERLGREAVAFAAASDFLDAHGDALVDLAEVLRLAGRPQEAASPLRHALRLYEQKGNVASASKARALLGAASAAAAPAS